MFCTKRVHIQVQKGQKEENKSVRNLGISVFVGRVWHFSE